MLLAAFIILFNILSDSSNYNPPQLYNEPSVNTEAVDNSISIKEPSFSYNMISLNFCGTITPGTLLGSESFGTFNSYLKENGPGCFLSKLTEMFKNDDYTFSICGGVLSDNLDLFPGNDESYIGMAGMHGTKTSNYAISDCDLLIALGARFSDRVIDNAKEFAPKASVLHIDIDPAEIHKNIRAASWLIGDVKEILQAVDQELSSKGMEKSTAASCVRSRTAAKSASLSAPGRSILLKKRKTGI